MPQISEPKKTIFSGEKTSPHRIRFPNVYFVGSLAEAESSARTSSRDDVHVLPVHQSVVSSKRRPAPTSGAGDALVSHGDIRKSDSWGFWRWSIAVDFNA
jgi:hypothetical protein